MEMLEIKTNIQIRRKAEDVFEAIVNPQEMSNYFIARGSGYLEEGSKIYWQFPEFEMEFPIQVDKIEKNLYISYYWEVLGKKLLVEIHLKARSSEETVVTVTEKAMKNDDEGIKWLKSNTEGWANFLACMKAYLEYGINLRKGAFDFMTDKN